MYIYKYNCFCSSFTLLQHLLLATVSVLSAKLATIVIIIMTTTIPIFNPNCVTEEDVENNVKQFAKKNNAQNNNTLRYVHSFDSTKQCIFQNGVSRWEKITEPINLQSLLNERRNLVDVENRIEDLIKNTFLRKLNLSSIDPSSIIIQPLPEGVEKLQCKVDTLTPPLFVVSNTAGGDYFDLVVHPIFGRDDIGKPICFRQDSRKQNHFSFQHSGDIRTNEFIIRNDDLLQYIQPIRSENYNATGVVTAHAYNKKTFFKIRACDPTICLIDYCKVNKTVNIYVIHFPLSKDFVQNSCVGHICKFDYNAKDGIMNWTIPSQPTFIEQSFNVGEGKEKYEDGVKLFMENVNLVEMRDKVVATSEMKDEVEDFSPSLVKRQKLTAFDEQKVLIIQKPLLQLDEIQTSLMDILEKNKFKTFTFHRNIDIIKCNDVNDDSDEYNYDYTLPIAGGSILSEKSSVKLGKPIALRSIADSFQNFLSQKNGYRPIVFVSNKASSANIPKIHSKLNAVYVLVDCDENASLPTVDRLNHINAILPVSMQGSLSTIFVHMGGNYYYYRGIIYNKMNVEFGQGFTLEDVLSEACDRRLETSIVTESSSPYWPVYDNLGKNIFNVYNEADEDVNAVALSIIENIQSKIRPVDGKNINSLESQLHFIIAQLEVNLNVDKFKKITSIVARNVYQSTQITQRNCLKLILQNLSRLENYLRHVNAGIDDISQEIENVSGTLKYSINRILESESEKLQKNYNRQWLVEILGASLNVNKFEVLINSVYQQTLRYIFIIINEFIKSRYQGEKLLFQLLNTSVPMRSSHGIRSKGLAQIIRREDIQENVKTTKNITEEQLDSLIQDHCSKNGVIFLSFERAKMIDNLSMAISYEPYIKALTKRFDEFDRMDAFMATAFFQDKNFLFEYTRARDYNQVYKMIIFPILDELEEAMKNPSEYNWREIKPNGSVDLTRILLRKSIYDALDDKQRLDLKIKDPGHPHIGKILINLLFSAIYAMAGNRRDFSNTKEDDAWMSQLRCLTGLILSVMASGTSRPFSLVYQVILFGHRVSEVDINLSTPEENLWLREMINIWSWLKLDKIDVRQNAVDNVLNQVVKKSQRLLLSKNVEDEEEENKQKRQKKMKEDLMNRMRAKAAYYHNVIQPFIVFILSLEFPIVHEEDSFLSSLNYSGTGKYEDFLEMKENNDFVIHKNISTEEKTLMKQKMQKLLLLTKKGPQRKMNKNPIPRNISENVSRIVLKYKEIKRMTMYSSDENLKKYFKASKFLRNVDGLCKQFDERNKVSDHTLNIVYLMAKEIYLNKSLFLYGDLVKLNNYIFKTHPENMKGREQFKKEKYQHLEGILMKDNLSVIEKYGSERKVAEINRRAEKKRLLDSQPLMPFSLEVANSFKYAILSKCLRFIDLSQDYWKIHKVFIELIKCETQDDFQSKQFRDLLHDYLKAKFKYGHFMNAYLLENDYREGKTLEIENDDELLDLKDRAILEEKERIKNELDLRFRTDKKLKNMIEFLYDYNIPIDFIKQCCLQVIQQEQN